MGADSDRSRFVADSSTEAEASAERLREAAEHYRRLVELSPLAIGVHRDGVLVFANDAAAQLLGFERPADLLGRHIMSFVHPDDRALVTERVRAAEEGTAFLPLVEERFVRSDGSVVHVEVTSRPIVYRGKPAIHVVARDITVRKEAEEALRRSEARHRMLVEAFPDPLFVIDAEGRYVDFSAGSGQPGALPDDLESFIGRTMKEVLPEPLATEAREAMDRALQTDRVQTIEYELDLPGGRRHFEARFVPGVEGEGAISIRDVTQWKRAEQTLLAALEREREVAQQLRAVDEMKNMFLAAVSHELRTPLASILGISITLQRSEVELSRAETMDLVARLAANARKLDQLLSDLLDLDRLLQGVVKPRRLAIDVGSLVESTVAGLGPLDRHPLSVDAESVTLPVDPGMVERIVENLVLNASRHTPEATPIRVTVAGGDDGVIITVEDEGPGIPDEAREAIFEPFRQGPNRTMHAPGVGVGLALVAKFAELHGGRAWVESREGGGSSFRVLLAGDTVSVGSA